MRFHPLISLMPIFMDLTVNQTWSMHFKHSAVTQNFLILSKHVNWRENWLKYDLTFLDVSRCIGFTISYGLGFKTSLDNLKITRHLLYLKNHPLNVWDFESARASRWTQEVCQMRATNCSVLYLPVYLSNTTVVKNKTPQEMTRRICPTY